MSAPRECLYCKGNMEKTESSYTVNRRGYHLFIEMLPVYICSQCGEKHFAEAEVEAIQKMIRHLETDIKKVHLVGTESSR